MRRLLDLLRRRRVPCAVHPAYEFVADRYEARRLSAINDLLHEALA